MPQITACGTNTQVERQQQLSRVDQYPHCACLEYPYTMNYLLRKFSEITRPDGMLREVKHAVEHFINIVPGQLVSCKPCRLAPNKRKMAQHEFALMLQQGISPLHIVPKKDGEWRSSGEYRNLDARTIPDRYPVRHIEYFVTYYKVRQFFLRSIWYELSTKSRSPKNT